jgi:small subunit ribosomal protein S6
MRKYECFVIIDADLTDDAIAGVDEKVKNVVAGNGGTVLDYVPWGKKKLAYPVRKRTRGHYVLMEFAGESGLVAELERNLRLDERILKFITVMIQDRYDPQAEEAKQPKPLPPFTDEEVGKVVPLATDEELAGGGEGEDEAHEDLDTDTEDDEEEES